MAAGRFRTRFHTLHPLGHPEIQCWLMTLKTLRRICTHFGRLLSSIKKSLTNEDVILFVFMWTKCILRLLFIAFAMYTTRARKVVALQVPFPRVGESRVSRLLCTRPFTHSYVQRDIGFLSRIHSNSTYGKQ